MKTLASLFILVFIGTGSACSTFNGSGVPSNPTSQTSAITASQQSSELPEKYIQVLDELIANGCDISKFEIIERTKALDMKVACK